MFYDLVLMVTGLLNTRLIRIATSPPVVDEHADRVVVARTRARGWSVTIGAALAFVVAFFAPKIAQFALISIPFWLRLLVRRAERKALAA